MTSPAQSASKIENSIREVLNRDWDPIHVLEDGITDEYDSYIGQIYRLLVSSPSKHAVALELRRIEAESMGFSYGKPEALFHVAEKLLSIDIRLNK